MEYSQEFIKAFNHAMLYEVGGQFNPADPDVIAGRITTAIQRKKVGYVNLKQDRGGETKFGIAQNANPQVRVNTLTLEQAMNVYFKNYWLAGKCDKLPYNIALIHFDGCINHGVGRASRFLQRAVGAVEDGQIGPATLRAIATASPQKVVESISHNRSKFYNSIVQNDPSQKMFLAGWTRRINEVTDFTLKS